jgi:glycosyltransferase involved in cell wall biosynthesis
VGTADPLATWRLHMLVADQYEHHSVSSGYHQIARLFPRAGWISLRALERRHLNWLRRPTFVGAEIKSLDDLVSEFGGEILWHILYGDMTRVSNDLREIDPRSKVIVTLHQPVSLLRTIHPDILVLQEVDALAALSEEQAAELRELNLGPRVFSLHHGIWTGTFKSAPSSVPDDCVLFVGEHLRDWLLLTRVARQLETDRSLHLRLVIPRIYSDWFRHRPNTIVETQIPEGDLITCYQRSLVLLLPLQGAVANNAILEAMSCGCPVLTNRLPSVEEYLGDEGIYFSEGDANECVHKIKSLRRKSHGEQSSLRAALAARAARFDWNVLRPSYASFYQAVWSSGPWTPPT